MQYRNYLCLILLAAAACQPKPGAKNERPNIIFILADDLGYMDTQVYAHRETGTDTALMFYETPNINRLISQGTAFSQAYATQLCSPTRASLLTGKYAGRLGFTTAMPLRNTYYNQVISPPENHYLHDAIKHEDNIQIEQALINGTSNAALPSGTPLDQGWDEVTIAEALTGYHSAYIGKWHLGGFGAEGYQPSDQGFEALAWMDGGGSPYYDWRELWDRTSTERFPDIPQPQWRIGDSGDSTSEEYLTDDLTAQALRYLERRSEDQAQPFFLYFAHFAVHSPYQGVEEEVSHFDQKPTRGWNGHRDPVYASMIKSLDRSVGQIMNQLVELGLDDNTLVVFMSDNGGIDAELTPNNMGTENAPFLGGKACLTEGGIRVPLAFYWKGRIESGRWVDTPVDCTDIFPTLSQMAGYSADSLVNELALDGRSFSSLLFRDDTTRYTKDTRYWHYPFNVIYNNPRDGFSLTPHSAIREKQYKLIYDWYGRLYLHDIEADPYEQTNLAEKMPELTDRLFGQLRTWLEGNVAPRYWPSPNDHYRPVREVREQPYRELIPFDAANARSLSFSR